MSVGIRRARNNNSIDALYYLFYGRHNKETELEQVVPQCHRFTYTSHCQLSLPFQVNTQGYIICWTDGSCSRNGQDGAAAGIGVYFGDQHPWNITKPLDPRIEQTNNRAEIWAAIEAIRKIREKGIHHVEIRSDSDFMVKGMNVWIHEWERNGWRQSSTGFPIENEMDFRQLKNEVNSVSNVHIPRDQNKQADALARAGVNSQHRV
ncbi:unnamed protein product [Allacma fusca]|uniref:ribonuclease H n=1 Tax=Allacma fusca TaxID=39272 RepID=A0A8J2JBB3_9HEXA|nr:unnamed protein product [Allacma fusca]